MNPQPMDVTGQPIKVGQSIAYQYGDMSEMLIRSMIVEGIEVIGPAFKIHGRDSMNHRACLTNPNRCVIISGLDNHRNLC
jgi:hypothetical protein